MLSFFIVRPKSRTLLQVLMVGRNTQKLTTMEGEKIICCDGTRGDALAWAAMANAKNNDPMAMLAAVNGGMGGQWNNPLN